MNCHKRYTERMFFTDSQSIKTSSNHRLESAGLNALEELLLMRALF